VAEKGLDDVSR